MSEPASDLIIEASTSHASPVHREEKRGSFTVITSRDGRAEYKTVVTGAPAALSLDKKRELVTLTGSLLAGYFRSLGLRDGFCALVVGFGNPSVTSDSLGSLVADRVLADGERSFVCRPFTKAKTGFDSVQTVRSAALRASADVIVAVDALAARYAERLGTVIQLSDGGIAPGSGVSCASGEISRATMPCPVVSLGVPTVIRYGGTPSMFVTPADVDTVTETFSIILAGGINSALTGNINARPNHGTHI